MAYIDFIGALHSSAERNYLQRVTNFDKAECATVAKKWGRDYWDGNREFGYGGYYYDGRWGVIAQSMIDHYGIKPGDRILDVGCGKGYLLYEFSRILPGVEITGVDISKYAIENGKPEVKNNLFYASASSLPLPDDSQDFIVSITTLHNLKNFDLFKSLKEINRVSKNQQAHITVESYRNEKEKANLLYWQLTCESFYTPEEWEWFFSISGYEGDFGCIFFE